MSAVAAAALRPQSAHLRGPPARRWGGAGTRREPLPAPAGLCAATLGVRQVLGRRRSKRLRGQGPASVSQGVAPGSVGRQRIEVTGAKMPAAYLQPRRAWAAMLVYWACGALCALRYRGMLGAGPPSVAGPLSGAVYGSAALATLLCAGTYAKGSLRFGRRWNPAVSAVFALLNGTCETALFLTAFDVGWSSAPGSALPAGLLGYASFLVYSAAVHIFFWEPCVFPPHIATGEPKWRKVLKICLLAAASSSWLLCYKMYGDVVTPCVLHALLNFVGDWSICMPPPWARFSYTASAREAAARS